MHLVTGRAASTADDFGTARRSASVRRSIRHGFLALTVAGFSMIALSVFATPAQAHDELTASSPEADEHVDTAPPSVDLQFGGELLGVGATIVVAGADGRDWANGDAAVAGATVSAPVDGALPNGNYDVRWQVVSGDGDVVNGHFPFAVGDLTDAAPVAVPTTGQSPSGDAPSGAQVALATSSPNSTTEGLPTVAIAAIGAGAALIAALLFQWIRGSRSRR